MVGHCGMTQRQAAWTSVGEFLQRKEGYEKIQQLEWERQRWLAWSIITPFLGKNKPRTPQQFARFPWESVEAHKMIAIDESQITALNEIYKQFEQHKKV